jgi:ribonucleoside-diphosphate reductase alpha chain
VAKKARSDVLTGKTKRIKTGCGNLYVTVNSNEGTPIEVFCKLGKAGGCGASQMEAIGRLISAALREGLEMSTIVKHLLGISCHKSYGYGVNKVLSCSDGVAQILKEWVKEEAKDAS